MGQKRLLPEHSLIVTEYDELRKLVQAFARGHHELLTIVGDGGIGKTEMVKRTMVATLGTDKWTLIKGKHSPLDLYRKLYESCLLPLVLDDLDGLFLKPDNALLLKCVCDTTLVKAVEWGSTHRAFQAGEPPLANRFESISRVCIIANEWQTLRNNIVALQDRGVLVFFKPTALELHKEIAQAGWFEDTEVFDFLGRNLFLITRPSFRLYITAQNHKRAGLDWRDLILRTIESEGESKLLLVARLLADPHYDGLMAPETARERAFQRRGGGSRATYHRYKAELLDRRGDFDMEEAQSIALAPRQLDAQTMAMMLRRRQLEELRDASGGGQRGRLLDSSPSGDEDEDADV